MKIKAKKAFLGIAAAVAVAGCGLFIAGSVLGSKPQGDTIDILNPDSFKSGVSGVLHIDEDHIFDYNGIITYDYSDDFTTYIVILEGYDNNRFSLKHFVGMKDSEGNSVVNVTVKECPEDLRQQAVQNFVSYYTMLYEFVSGEPDPPQEYVDYLKSVISEDGIAELDSSVSHLMCEVTPTADYSFLKNTGIVVAFAGLMSALICLLSFKIKGRTIALAFGIIAVMSIAVICVVLRKNIATVLSLKEYKPGVYTMYYTSDYKLDSILDSGVVSESDFLSWAETNLYYGLPLSMKENLFGCAAFAVTAPDGNHLMGRNTDYPETDCLMLYCSPKNGYDSIAMVDLAILNIGNDEDKLSPTSFAGRVSTLAMPYMVLEGMNEAGFGVSILELDFDEIHQDTGRKDVLMNVAVRAVLDKCATVDEAVKLLDEYDMNTMLGATFHLFMCDRTGRSVVVEWLGDKMYVTESPAVTNYVIGDTSYYGEEDGDGRYEILMEALDRCGHVTGISGAMGFLSDVADDNRASDGIGTEWSCIYDLDNFSLTVCFDMNYYEQIMVTRDTFR